MKPRKDVFASGYIEETVDTFINTINIIDKQTFIWSRDVLNEYFNVINLSKLDNGSILKNKFKVHITDIEDNTCHNSDVNNLVPYKRVSHKLPSFETLYNLALYRRSVRWFLPKMVDKDIILNAIEVSKLSPSACNRLPFKFYISENTDVAKNVLSCAGGTTGFADNIPHVAVVTGNLANYEYETDRHLIYIDSALSSMSFCNALECQGVSSVCINWHNVTRREQMIRKYVPVNNDEQIIMLIGFGIADPNGMVPSSGKKCNESIMEFF